LFAAAVESPVLPAGAYDVTHDVVQRREAATVVTDQGEFAAVEPGQPHFAAAVGFDLDRHEPLETLARELRAELACRVDRRVLLDGPTPEGYVKNLGLLRRARTLSPEGFARHWNGEHARLALASSPRFVRYATNVVVTASAPFEWDGVVEQWFTSTAELERHAALEAPGRQAVLADVARMVSAMEVILTGPGPAEVTGTVGAGHA
jgi:hypothetical protein